MHGDAIIFSLFLIFTGAAVLATAALYARQALIVVYIALGFLLGPWGLGYVADPTLIKSIAQVGIIFLLFLLGLNLHPQKLLHMLRAATFITLASSLAFAVPGVVAGLWFGFTPVESLLIGAALMFSSTILGLKLLPTTVLHHRHAGEIVISVLLLQDIIAILILLVLHGLAQGEVAWQDFVRLAFALPALVLAAFLFERYVLTRLLARFDTIREYVFLVAVGWCLGLAEFAVRLGLSYEIGAFVAGVAIAASPIALYIAENLKPLRDFFLVLFFFSLGAGFDPGVLRAVALPAVLLAVAVLVCKPFVFRALLARAGEEKSLAWEIGVRLGQVSEFSLLIAVIAFESGVIGGGASALIQAATLITFIVSSYIIVLRFPTPIAVSDRLRRD